VKGYIKMTIQTLLDAWKTSGAYISIEAPATDAEIQAAEQKIGATLPQPLREIYQLLNGGWMWDLGVHQLEPDPDKELGLTEANERYIEWGWHIPQEIRLFAQMGGDKVFGIWLPICGNPIYNHPIIEVGTLPAQEGCMGLVGTNLISFVQGWSAFRLMARELDKSKEVAFLDSLQVPQSLWAEHHHEDPDENFAQLRKWADPQLPDPYGDSYSQEYTIADLKKLFGDT